MNQITTIIHTKNSQTYLESAIKSVAFSDHLIIADMGSTDQTLKISAKYPTQIVHLKDLGFADPARNQVIELAPTKWILVVDSDEEIPPGLAQKLISITKEKSSLPVWKIPRKNIIFGKWIRHTGWWPDYQYHFFKKGHVTWGPHVHTHPQIKGPVDQIEALEKFAKIHHNYDTIDQFINRLNKYTSLEINKPKLQLQPTALEEFIDQFCSRYIHQSGYQDHTHGYQLALLQAIYQATTHLKLWENNHFPEMNQDHLFNSLKQAVSTLRYWQADLHLRTLKPTNPQYLIWKIRKKLKI